MPPSRARRSVEVGWLGWNDYGESQRPRRSSLLKTIGSSAGKPGSCIAARMVRAALPVSRHG